MVANCGTFKTNIESVLRGRVSLVSLSIYQSLLLLLTCWLIAATAAAAVQPAAEAAVSAGVVLQRICQLALPELGPHRVTKVQLCRHSGHSGHSRG